ncbi:MAG: DUF6268 family outer membrane beta-barrel protein [Rhodothermaceae bacterium]
MSKEKSFIYLIQIILGFFILFASDIQAQLPKPTLTIETDFFGKKTLKDSPIDELKNSSAKITSLNFKGSFSYPFIADQGNRIFFIEAQYRQRYFVYHNWPANLSKEIDHLHEINLSFTLYQNIGRNWAMSLNVTPQLASNFEEKKLSKEDFKFQGAIVFEKQFSEKWRLGFGAAYSTTFGKPIPIPLITFSYDSGNKWYAYGNLPAEMNIFYRLSNYFDLGFITKADGGMYHVPETYPEETKIKDPELQYVSILFGPSIKFKYSRFELFFRGGLAYQKYGLYDGTKELKDYQYEFKLGHSLNGNLKIHF